MVEIQELQDKVTFLNDAKDFYDPETAGGSGLSQSTHASSESSRND